MSRPSIYKFCLYVAGDTLNSAAAIANLGALCREYLPGRHEIELIDVIKDPRSALSAGISMTPTLIKNSPGPVRRVIGNLSQSEPVLQALGLGTVPK
jgi:circadian clock protein KaiB